MNNSKKILLVQLFSNGDCLYATAVARQIKQDFPDAHLTWAIATFCRHIIDLNPYVDAVRVVDNVPKSDVIAFRKFVRQVNQEKQQGLWDEVFVTTNMDANLAYFDGTIRGMILQAYPSPITVPLQPVLVLSEEEKNNVKKFAEQHQLSRFKHVVLWEYAPQSGQLSLNQELVFEAARKLTRNPNICIILSSPHQFDSQAQVIDASVLTVRENAALTHYCNLMIGCSSGITWISTSSAARALPMIQLINPDVAFLNAPSIDFERFGIDTELLIELTTFDHLAACVADALLDFHRAKQQFHQVVRPNFNTTRIIVYNLLCYLHFGALFKHFRLNIKRYGWRGSFLRNFFLGLLLSPFTLIKNKVRKKS